MSAAPLVSPELRERMAEAASRARVFTFSSGFDERPGPWLAAVDAVLIGRLTDSDEELATRAARAFWDARPSAAARCQGADLPKWSRAVKAILDLIPKEPVDSPPAISLDLRQQMAGRELRSPVRRLQLVVEYVGHRTRYYPVARHRGWKIDTDARMITIGRGLPRTMIPLDSVLSFTIEEVDHATGA